MWQKSDTFCGNAHMQERIVRPRQAFRGCNFFPAITREGKHDADLSATAAAASLLEGMVSGSGVKITGRGWRGESKSRGEDWRNLLRLNCF